MQSTSNGLGIRSPVYQQSLPNRTPISFQIHLSPLGRRHNRPTEVPHILAASYRLGAPNVPKPRKNKAKRVKENMKFL
ncbi:hypothetical protein ACOME3_005580 [Neoechinorhynchus agilis]